MIDLDAIEARWQASRHPASDHAASWYSAQDVPALLEEVHRLREAVGPGSVILDIRDFAALQAELVDLRGRLNRARVALNPNGPELAGG